MSISPVPDLRHLIWEHGRAFLRGVFDAGDNAFQIKGPVEGALLDQGRPTAMSERFHTAGLSLNHPVCVADLDASMLDYPDNGRVAWPFNDIASCGSPCGGV